MQISACEWGFRYLLSDFCCWLSLAHSILTGSAGRSLLPPSPIAGNAGLSAAPPTNYMTSSCIYTLKLYCRYLYTKPCMINHIWDLKQLWLQVNGHAWFHLQRLRWPVRNGEEAKNSKWKYMSPAGFEPTPRQSTTGKSQRLRPLGHEGLMVISG